jgi:BirA family biotin operon repressor/biotin-[acetyl-CoA-carboxylase] ligase
MEPSGRLFPSMIRERLSARLLGRRIYYFPEVDSTNRAAMELAKSGEPEGTLVITDFQTKGRGRLDHTWSSPEGKDLLFSLILRPHGEPGFILPSTLAFSVTISETLSESFDVHVGVNWPNDLVTVEGKIGGILAERSTDRAGASPIVVGVGINVNSQKADFPTDFRDGAVSFRILTGDVVDRVRILTLVLESLETCYRRFRSEGFPFFRKSYVDRLLIKGRRVWFDRGGERCVGTVAGVQDDGALIVTSTAKGETLALYNEEVSVES